jgi:phosphoribosylformylglycinamidine cyclo-ligase
VPALGGPMADGQFTYKQAGVDVEAGNRAVDLLKERVKSGRHPLVLGGLGGFGGAMRLPRLKDPVLVAGTDGVGTKIEVARALGRLDTIGIDLVAMSVNDVSACGAVPLFFLDYLVVGKVVPEVVATIVAGVDEGCLRAQCALLGGETAEHPGQFPDGDFDLAGFAVGLAERDELWGPQLVQDGDVLLGLRSSGLHSNGFSLVRHLLKEHQIGLHEAFSDRLAALHGEIASLDAAATVGEVLLTPTAI